MKIHRRTCGRPSPKSHPPLTIQSRSLLVLTMQLMHWIRGRKLYCSRIILFSKYMGPIVWHQREKDGPRLLTPCAAGHYSSSPSPSSSFFRQSFQFICSSPSASLISTPPWCPKFLLRCQEVKGHAVVFFPYGSSDVAQSTDDVMARPGVLGRNRCQLIIFVLYSLSCLQI
jgi:hypothetical protein